VASGELPEPAATLAGFATNTFTLATLSGTAVIQKWGRRIVVENMSYMT
jgi:hypothetical protein